MKREGIFMNQYRTRMQESRAGLAGLLIGLAVFAGGNKILGDKPVDTNDYSPPVRELDRSGEYISLSRTEDKKDNLDYFAEYTMPFEGFRTRVYDARPNDPKAFERTIGVGHFLDRGDSRETFKRVMPNVNYDSIYSGKTELTKEQVNLLFKEDLKIYVQRAKKLVPKFDSYPVYLQQALVDMAYRGDLAGSPKTVKLINENNFRSAADEYINNREYKSAESRKMLGVKKRMDSNRERIFRYSIELGK